tara:strand:- start:3670 stop:4623 length:954 start_codon:yes stop_codon:yes gene_type:complete
MIVLNRFLDFSLIKFPIVFPLIYLYALYSFPSYENFLIIFTILILAETHFGATWPFFISKYNTTYIKENKLNLIIVPIIIIVFSIIAYFNFQNIFLLAFFMANVYHVTRQSVGICKLYNKKQDEFEIQKYLIYFFALLFFFIAFLKFYLSLNLISNFNLTFICSLLILFSIIFYIYFYKFNENLFCLITGILIFFPVCFLENPVHLIIMGVTMHYSQYIAMTYKVTVARNLKNKIINNSKTNIFDYFNIYFFCIIILYSSVMSYISYYTKDTINPNLILIPIIGQFLHFYLDSQLWKFSIKHNVENVLKNLRFNTTQ